MLLQSTCREQKHCPRWSAKKDTFKLYFQPLNTPMKTDDLKTDLRWTNKNKLNIYNLQVNVFCAMSYINFVLKNLSLMTEHTSFILKNLTKKHTNLAMKKNTNKKQSLLCRTKTGIYWTGQYLNWLIFHFLRNCHLVKFLTEAQFVVAGKWWNSTLLTYLY